MSEFISAWTITDPSACPTCGRESCEDHLPADPESAPRAMPDPPIEPGNGVMTAADLTLEAFAIDETLLVDRFVDVTIKRNAYRELAHEAIHRLADVAQQLKRLQEQHWRLLDEFRFVRQAEMCRTSKRGKAA